MNVVEGYMTAEEAHVIEGAIVKLLNDESAERVEHTKIAVKAAASRPVLF